MSQGGLSGSSAIPSSGISVIALDSGSISGSTVTLRGGSTGLSTIAFSATTGDLTGILNSSSGGTGLNASGATNGQLLIGNGSGFSLAALTAGTGITITNGAGTITITSTATGGVSSITGTTDQITASASTGAVTLSIPTTVAIGSSNTAATSAQITLNATTAYGTVLAGTQIGTDTNKSQYGLYVESILSPPHQTGGTGGNQFGIGINPTITQTGSSTTFNWTGGLYINSTINASSTSTNFAGIFIDAISDGGVGTSLNFYGLYVSQFTDLTVENFIGVSSPNLAIGSSGQFFVNTSGQVTSGTWEGSKIALAYGGTNADLTASNGGIFYSTGSAGAILSGTATALQMLQSGASTTPAWSTTTWPATTTANQILYSSSASVVGQITTADNGVLITGTSGIPSFLAAGTTGQVLIATTSNPASWGTLSSIAVTTLTGSANEILVNGTSGSATSGAITLTTPQQIGTSSTPQFAALGLGTASTAVPLTISSSGEEIRLVGGSSTQTYITFYSSATRQGYIGTGAGGQNMLLDSLGTILLQPNDGTAALYAYTNGGVSIGSYAASEIAPPSGGIIVSGQVGIGTSTLSTGASGSALQVEAVSGQARGLTIGLSTNITGSSAATPFGFVLTAGLQITSGTQQAIAAYINPNPVSGAGTMTNCYGLYIDTGASNTVPTNGYGLYVSNPAFGTNKICAYFSGQVGMGVSVPNTGTSGATLQIEAISGQNRLLTLGELGTSTLSVSGGANVFGVVEEIALQVTGGTTALAISNYIYPNPISGSGTMTACAGLYIDTGPTNTVPGTGYGLYVNTPAFGTAKVCAFFQGPVQMASSATGSTTALLATANCPATTGTSPYVWLKLLAPDGSTIYVPGWK